MDRARASQGLGGEGHVGGLGGHPDDRGEVQEVPVVGHVVVREVQAAPARAAIAFAVVLVRIVQGEDDLHEQPRPGDSGEGQGDAQPLPQAVVGLGQGQLHRDGDDAGDRRDDRQGQDEVLSLILTGRARPDLGLVAGGHHRQGEGEKADQQGVPGEHDPGAHPQFVGGQAQGRSHDGAGQDRRRQPRPVPQRAEGKLDAARRRGRRFGCHGADVGLNQSRANARPRGQVIVRGMAGRDPASALIAARVGSMASTPSTIL